MKCPAKPEASTIGLFQLVLDNDCLPGCVIPADEIEWKASNWMFSRLQFELHAEKFGQHIGILE